MLRSCYNFKLMCYMEFSYWVIDVAMSCGRSMINIVDKLIILGSVAYHLCRICCPVQGISYRHVDMRHTQDDAVLCSWMWRWPSVCPLCLHLSVSPASFCSCFLSSCSLHYLSESVSLSYQNSYPKTWISLLSMQYKTWKVTGHVVPSAAQRPRLR